MSAQLSIWTSPPNRMFPGVEVPVDTISVKIDVSGVLVEAEMAARGRRPCFRRIQTIQFLTSRQLRPKCARSPRSACRPTESKSVEALIWFNTSRLGLLYTLQPAPWAAAPRAPRGAGPPVCVCSSTRLRNCASTYRCSITPRQKLSASIKFLLLFGFLF